MKIKAVLFDMDGVLIDAKDWHYEALNKALELFGMPISRYDHLNIFDGLPTRKKLEILYKEKDLPFELHEFINEMKQRYTMDLVYTQCHPRFVHEYALSKLKAKNYFTAVCTNSVRKTANAMMELSGLNKYLDLVLSNEDVKNCKPDPEMYLKAIQYFDLKPNECLILEDNENGIKAAKASGANLLIIKEVEDANLENILAAINQIES